MSDEEHGFDPVMPFVTVQSKGGPHDDESYVAGYEMGVIDAELSGRLFDQGQPIHAENRGQADLIAMRYGFAAEFTPENDGWVQMRVRREVVVDEP